MYENKSLQLAILISIFLHFTIFLSAPYTTVLPEKQHSGPIKVAYFKIEQEPEELIEQRFVGEERKTQLPPPIAPEALPKVGKEDIMGPISLPPIDFQVAVKPDQVKNEELTVETIGTSPRAIIGGKGKKFEAVVNDEKDSGKRATYIGYYRLVREKIRYYADKNYIKEGSTNQGEIFLSFVIASNGELLHIMIIDRRSADDLSLRNIAVNSVRDASPFPAFPQGMNQYQITFNVVISFELNK